METGPFPLSILDSMTTPLALSVKDAFRSSISDWSKILSFSLSKFIFLTADTSTNSGFRYHGRETGTGAVQLFNFGQSPGFFGNLSAGGNSDANGYGDFQYAVPSTYFAINSKNLAVIGD